MLEPVSKRMPWVTMRAGSSEHGHKILGTLGEPERGEHFLP
jgi:hypothetical protein